MIKLNRKQRLIFRKIKSFLLKISPVILLMALISITFYTVFIRYVYERDTKDLLLDAQKVREQQIQILQEEIYKKEQEEKNLQYQIEELKKQALLPLPVRLVKRYFKNEKDSITMLAILKTESGLNPKAKGYNCYYNGKSQACKTGDEQNAWSVDCGLAQNNFHGLNCPDYAFDPEWSVKEAYRKYSYRGFQPWTVFNTGKYRNNLAWAEGQI